MSTWELSIKPDSVEGYHSFNLCKDNSILAVGWAGAYSSEQPKNLEEAKILVNKKYNNWPHAIKYLFQSVKKDDHVWMHQKGYYFLCKAKDEILIGSEIHKDFIKYDLGHARKATWVKVPEQFISGSIQRGTIAQRMIQRIKITQEEKQFNEILFSKLSINPAIYTPGVISPLYDTMY